MRRLYSQRRQKKPKRNNSWIIIGLFLAMGCYSWDSQKTFKQRQEELSRYYVDTTTSSYSTNGKSSSSSSIQTPSFEKIHSDASTSITSAPIMRSANAQDVEEPSTPSGEHDGDDDAISDSGDAENNESSPPSKGKEQQDEDDDAISESGDGTNNESEGAKQDDEDDNAVSKSGDGTNDESEGTKQQDEDGGAVSDSGDGTNDESEGAKQQDEDENAHGTNDESSLPPPPLNLIPNNQLREHDYFSDSWIITKEKFLNLERRRLGIVEDACFVAIGSGGSVYPTSKMFVDWTDFMVEHMSKWWNELRILHDSNSQMFDLTVQYFDQYIERVLENSSSQPSTFHETIAVVAFAPYKSPIADRSHVLTFHSLAATLASLYHVGFGRVVIAGYGEPDQHHVEATLEFLLGKATAIGSTAATSKTQIKIGNTEFGFAKVVEKDWISTKWVEFNMPRGAVIGLQEALLGNITDEGGKNHKEVTSSAAWLGSVHDASYWKYVYLTEPDTILHTKLDLLPSIKEGLDNGLSFFPHRLQPIPHGSDLPSGKNMTKDVSSAHSGRFVPNHVLPFSNVTTLDSTSSKKTTDMDAEGSVGVTAYHCCDAGTFPKHEDCGGPWWWTCGFHDKVVQAELTQEDALEKHKRLASYPMMRLKQGTRIVFGPTEHGRKCIPSKDPCPLSISEDNQG